MEGWEELQEVCENYDNSVMLVPLVIVTLLTV